MSLIKRRKDRDQSAAAAAASHAPSRKLFVDYPYPIITELAETHERRRKSDHSLGLTSLKRCKHNLHKLFEHSFRRSSKDNINDLHNTMKSNDIEQNKRLR